MCKKFMKNYLWFTGFAITALFSGCATQQHVAQMEGHGRKNVFDAPYEAVWRAAVDATQGSGLNVVMVDKARGYIGAKRGMQMTTMGENVGVWVTRVSANQSQVEVVSRQAGLPMAWFKNWENQIINGVAANLTREGDYRAPVTQPDGINRYPEQRTYVPPAQVNPKQR